MLVRLVLIQLALATIFLNSLDRLSTSAIRNYTQRLSSNYPLCVRIKHLLVCIIFFAHLTCQYYFMINLNRADWKENIRAWYTEPEILLRIKFSLLFCSFRKQNSLTCLLILLFLFFNLFHQIGSVLCRNEKQIKKVLFVIQAQTYLYN